MRIIHCADIHVDSKMESHFSKEQADDRRKEIVDTFSSMVQFAKKNDVKVIIIAGDLFDTKTSQQKSIKKRISYIISQNPEIDFLYLRGNHDEDVDFAMDEDIPNLKRFSKDKWICYSYENINIYGHEFGKNIPVSSYSQLALDSSKFNIVTLHGQIAEYEAKDGAPVISLPHLTNKNIDYIALGHIHDYKTEKLDSRCSWCYSGCLAGRDFSKGEFGEKGFVLLDITDKLSTKFIPMSQRKIHEIYVNLNGTMSFNEIMTAISRKVESIPSKDIVLVNLVGKISEETEIEEDSYQDSLKSTYNFYFIRVKNNTKPKIDYAKYEKDISLKGEFIRLVKSQNDLSDDEKSKIIITGIKALSGRLE